MDSNDNLILKNYLQKALLFVGRVIVFFFLVYFFSLFWPGPYSPQEITELQTIPLILQGGTDMGGSNLFAIYASGYIFYGVIACFVFTLKFFGKDLKIGRIASLVIDQFFFSFYFATVAILLWTLLEGRLPISPFHILCQYIQLIVIFSVTSGFSYYFIKWLSQTNIPLFVKIVLSPIFFALMIWICWTGITPKAGQVLISSEVPRDLPNSERHEMLINLHKCCLGVFGY